MCCILCGLLSTINNWEMMEQVNARLAETGRFEALGWHWSKYRRLHQQYKKYYPAAPLLFRQRLLLIVSAVGVLLAAWGLTDS